MFPGEGLLEKIIHQVSEEQVCFLCTSDDVWAVGVLLFLK